MTSLLKNKTKTLRYIILLFIVSALGACDKQTVYHAFQSIPQEGWKRPVSYTHLTLPTT